MLDDELPTILDAVIKKNFAELFDDRSHQTSMTKIIPLCYLHVYSMCKTLLIL